VTLLDLSAHFYASEEDVGLGTSRADAAARHLRHLNPHCKVSVVSARHGPAVEASEQLAQGVRDSGSAEDSDPSRLAVSLAGSGRYGAVVAVDQPLSVMLRLNDATRAVSTSPAPHRQGDDSSALDGKTCAFVGCGVRGVFGMVFCDFGDWFHVRDPTGREPEPSPLQGLTIFQEMDHGGDGGGDGGSVVVEVECAEGEAHGLSANQRVHLGNLKWGPAKGDAKGDASSSGGGDSSSGGGSDFPSSLCGTVELLVGREGCTVRLDAPSSRALGSCLGSGALLPDLASGTVRLAFTHALAAPVSTIKRRPFLSFSPPCLHRVRVVAR
jgi:molybdopterin/thiamine biosynthesis adenylyltransferase